MRGVSAAAASIRNGMLALKSSGGAEALFHGVWLRDHCRGPLSMSPATEQRLTDTRLIPVDLEPASATLDGQRVIVQWPASEVDPAGGSSEFEASFLFQAAYCSAKAAAGDARPVPEDADWGNRSRYDDESSRGAMRALFGQAADPAAEAGVRAPRTPDRPGGTPGDAAAHPSDGAEGMRMPVDRLRAAGGVREAAEAIHRDGWLIIDGVAGTEMGTEEVAVPLFGWPMTTLYGEGFWRTEVHAGGGNDTAYTSLGLPPHTDGCYMAEQPGFQMFHCLKPATSGGDSTLVDGLAIADRLRQAHPDTFAALCDPSLRVPYHHTEFGQHMIERRPVFSLADGVSPADLADDRLGVADIVSRVHFNDVDRAVMSAQLAPPAAVRDMKAFYTHWQRLLDAAMSPDLEFRMSLRPGSVLVFDNQRMLHGRTRFDASSGRVLHGCYGSRESFNARWRARAGFPEWSVWNAK